MLQQARKPENIPVEKHNHIGHEFRPLTNSSASLGLTSAVFIRTGLVVSGMLYTPITRLHGQLLLK